MTTRLDRSSCPVIDVMASSGHPGTPKALAPVAYGLRQRILNAVARNVPWDPA